MDDGRRTSDLQGLVKRVFGAQARGPQLALSRLRAHWPDVVGPELGARTRPRRLAGGVLWIAAPDACWAYEMQFFTAELLASVQAFLESAEVREVRFRADPTALRPSAPPVAAGAHGTAPPVPEHAPEPLAQEGAPHARPEASPEGADAAEAPAALARAAQTIGDPALRAVFQRSLAKQARSRPPKRD